MNLYNRFTLYCCLSRHADAFNISDNYLRVRLSKATSFSCTQDAESHRVTCMGGRQTSLTGGFYFKSATHISLPIIFTLQCRALVAYCASITIHQQFHSPIAMKPKIAYLQRTHCKLQGARPVPVVTGEKGAVTKALLHTTTDSQGPFPS